VVVASKGRFDRALSRRKRADQLLPSEGSIFRDDFMEATTDLWRNMPPESATRVGHPAPFPVELPQRLIDLYTYRRDLVLDPFMGSGSTAVAALRSDRHYVGYDTDEEYVAVAEERIVPEREALAATREQREARRVVLPAIPEAADEQESFQARAVREGQKAKEIARAVLTDCGFDDFKDDLRLRSGVEVNLTARDRRGGLWYFDISGAFTTSRAGLRRTDTLWKALGKAAVLRAELGRLPRLILLSTDLPGKGGAGWAALSKARNEVYCDAIEMLSGEGQERLRQYANGEGNGSPLGELIPPAVVDDR
jgi:site-specific DNA-methyltransferase (adenine-specific)